MVRASLLLPPLTAPTFDESAEMTLGPLSTRSAPDRGQSRRSLKSAARKQRKIDNPPPKLFLTSGALVSTSIADASDSLLAQSRDEDPTAPPALPFSPKQNIQHSLSAGNPAESRLLLDNYRAGETQSALSVGARACQSEQNEKWAEMRAWNGYLATNL